MELNKNNLQGIRFRVAINSNIKYLIRGLEYIIGEKTKVNLLEMNSPTCYPIYDRTGEFVCKRMGYNILNNIKINSFLVTYTPKK